MIINKKYEYDHFCDDYTSTDMVPSPVRINYSRDSIEHLPSQINAARDDIDDDDDDLVDDDDLIDGDDKGENDSPNCSISVTKRARIASRQPTDYRSNKLIMMSTISH